MLIGVSLGPGDPGLMTFSAVDALKRCEKVFVPGEIAAELVRPYKEPEVLEFPMISDKKKLERIWAANADIVASFAREVETAFGCLGDVNTFSTFSHLLRLIRDRHPDIKIDTIPGVGVISALASRFEVSLDKSFEVTDGSEVDTVIVMKAVRPKEVVSKLRAQGFSDFILGSRLYMPEELIIREDMPDHSDYLTVLFARKR